MLVYMCICFFAEVTVPTESLGTRERSKCKKVDFRGVPKNRIFDGGRRFFVYNKLKLFKNLRIIFLFLQHQCNLCYTKISYYYCRYSYFEMIHLNVNLYFTE